MAFAFWTILTVSTLAVDTCSCARPSQESGTRLPLFLKLVLRSFRAALLLRVSSGWTLVASRNASHYPCLLAQPDNPRRLLHLTKAMCVYFRCSWLPACRSSPSDSELPAFNPALTRLMVSRTGGG